MSIEVYIQNYAKNNPKYAKLAALETTDTAYVYIKRMLYKGYSLEKACDICLRDIIK